MVKIDRIDGKVLVEQRTYYVYRNEQEYKNGHHMLMTSDEEMFNKFKS